MMAPKPLAARRRTNSSSCSVAVPSSWEESVVSGAIANRFGILSPLLNLKVDQRTIDRTSASSVGRNRFIAPLRALSRQPICRKPTVGAMRLRLLRPTRYACLMEDAPGVDDDGLAGHGLGAAHGD